MDATFFACVTSEGTRGISGRSSLQECRWGLSSFITLFQIISYLTNKNFCSLSTLKPLIDSDTLAIAANARNVGGLPYKEKVRLQTPFYGVELVTISLLSRLQSVWCMST
ncbi:MAG: hypothetical protein ACRD8Z_10855 [Nitrososphaeraceae archaeon]